MESEQMRALRTRSGKCQALLNNILKSQANPDFGEACAPARRLIARLNRSRYNGAGESSGTEGR
jgi:hypothetical protein